MALAQSADTMAVYRSPVAPIEDLTAAAEKVCACLVARKLAEARVAIDSLRVLANRRLGEGPASLGVQRQFFCSTLYSMCFCAKQLGADRELIDQVLWKVDSEILIVSPMPSASSVPRPTADLSEPDHLVPASVTPRCSG